MLVSDFDYNLPADLIAREPLAQRSDSRMLHLHRNPDLHVRNTLCNRRGGGGQRHFDLPSESLHDRQFREFPALLRADNLVVFNNTKVFPARLYGRRRGVHAQPVSKANPAARQFLTGQVEILLVRQMTENPFAWEALVHPGRKIDVGERLLFGEGQLEAEVTARGVHGLRHLRFAPVPDFFSLLEQFGHVPLPPYLDREDRPSDRERYQTIYARERGSVAAPTAGLHFTPEVLDTLRQRGIETAEITLHVGLGTFQPLHVESVEEHRLHREWYCISARAAQQINCAREAGRRVVAIGTTTVRTLEFVAASNAEGTVAAGTGEADLFIYPGFQFRVVEALLTNFHLPRSTLLMLVCALAGREDVLRAYRHAVGERYRFYSYGDCMLIE